MTEYNGYPSAVLDFIGECVGGSRYLCLVILDSEFSIKTCNRGFCRLLAAEDLVGLPLQAVLLPESGSLLNENILTLEQPLRLNFISTEQQVTSLECYLTQSGDNYLLFSDHLLVPDNDIFQKISALNSEMVALTRELARKNKELRTAQQEIKALKGIIPICMHCKEIRDDSGYWRNLESFIVKHAGVQFSHGICPECMKQHYPQPADGEE